MLKKKMIHFSLVKDTFMWNSAMWNYIIFTQR